MNNRRYTIPAKTWKRYSTLKRTPLKRKKTWKRLSPISKRRKREGAIYREKRFRFILENPVCKIKSPRCQIRTNVVHHSKGRVGSYFLDERWWIPSCEACNLYVEDHKAWAMKNGSRKDRIGRTIYE